MTVRRKLTRNLNRNEFKRNLRVTNTRSLNCLRLSRHHDADWPGLIFRGDGLSGVHENIVDTAASFLCTAIEVSYTLPASSFRFHRTDTGAILCIATLYTVSKPGFHRVTGIACDNVVGG